MINPKAIIENKAKALTNNLGSVGEERRAHNKSSRADVFGQAKIPDPVSVIYFLMVKEALAGRPGRLLNIAVHGALIRQKR